MNLCEQLNNEMNEKIDFKKINEVSDKEKIKLLKGEFKNAVGIHFAEKASDEDLLKMLKLTAKRETAWVKHHKEMKPLHDEIESIHRKYREETGTYY